MLIPNAINHALLYLVAIVAGSVLTGVLYALFKRGAEQERVLDTQRVEGTL
jgi:PTS system fructose-specific IIC component